MVAVSVLRGLRTAVPIAWNAVADSVVPSNGMYAGLYANLPVCQWPPVALALCGREERLVCRTEPRDTGRLLPAVLGRSAGLLGFPAAGSSCPPG